ncbi:MAG: EFR1 family ferrodoxin [Bacteroidales bacterium]|nr:EFR1 family ferrodoxin [Bacteroidales bacterium]
MIFYFSGTGNSAHAAQKLAQLLGDKVKNIADYYDNIYKGVDISLKDEKYLGIVCPVHSWGLAKPMARFLRQVRFKDYEGEKAFCMVTCGDTCGTADKQVKSLLKRHNHIVCCNVYSVQMPNTYIVMKGFGTDADVLRDQKLKNAEPEIARIAKAISTNSDYEHYVRGKKPFLKGRILYPLFMAFTMGDKKFFAEESCTGCGLCAKKCPEKNITMENNRPKWLGHCVKCLSCIHRCPARAIQYGDVTQDMGRYYYKD